MIISEPITTPEFSEANIQVNEINFLISEANSGAYKSILGNSEVILQCFKLHFYSANTIIHHKWNI